jgi:hypothetical protein
MTMSAPVSASLKSAEWVISTLMASIPIEGRGAGKIG